MDIPTVMYWNPNHWELRDSAIPYFDDLKRVGILHETPISAAQHVNTIWEDVDAWWYSRDVQIALEIFKERYSSISREGVVDRVKYALDEAISTSKKSEKLL
jgi:putative transferase (TIGR04331 family)